MSAKRTATRGRRSRRAEDAPAPAARESRRTIELAHELGYAYREYAH
jgi:hypothetical protein